MAQAPLSLKCPIRGELKTSAKSADGLTPSEEARRIEALTFLLAKGYPATHIKVEATVKRFGNQGRNSVRADLAALDIPVSSIHSGDVDDLLEHAVLLGEIKKDHKDASSAKATQVKPLLDFAHRDDCIALYWDNAEQRVFWREKRMGKRVEHEASANTLPSFGDRIAVKQLTLADIHPTDSLLSAFTRIEDILHAAAIDPEQRYGVILQLLLAKLYDEQRHAHHPDRPLGLQDYKALGTAPAAALKSANAALATATAYYSRYLPQPVADTLPITPSTLFDVMEVLAPIRILGSSQEVMQNFYMHFAKHLYKWDLAQFFTPITVTDFIARALSPGFGEHVKDPACGSADFLTSAYRIGSRTDPNYGQAIWGSDNSRNAVQVAVLNMLLNGDGKSNIELEDSLEKVQDYESQFDIVICNPPFGTKILEARSDVLSKFDLGHEWADSERGVPEKRAELRDTQQVGILFAELCVRHVRPGGRVGIILPNGYLGNRSIQYRALRAWLLSQCRVVSICSFPRFTFKTSGADVSASVVFLERRKRPSKRPSTDASYPIHVGTIEKVGWRLGDKKIKPEYQRSEQDGSFIVDPSGNYVLDTDFDRVLEEMRSSKGSRKFRWLARGVASPSGRSTGWSVPASTVAHDPTLTLDPKRLSKKVVTLRSSIERIAHWSLGELVEFIPERKPSWAQAGVYRYVELEDITSGNYRWKSLRGWELPDRARHPAAVGDVFIGSVWGSVQKWMLAGGDTADLIVTNGCHRLRIKARMEEYRVDLVAALSTEAFATQMRSLARGSDGLAEVNQADAESVLIPRLSPSLRKELSPFVRQLLDGHTGMKALIDDLVASGRYQTPIPAKRPSHSVLV